MKIAILLALTFISSYSLADSLVGTWTLSAFGCENSQPVNSDVAKGILSATSKVEMTFTQAGDFEADIAQGSCTLQSKGTYTIQASSIEFDIQNTTGSCRANIGSYSADYAISNGTLIIYQPLGYHGGQLCGPSVRAAQILTRK